MKTTDSVWQFWQAETGAGNGPGTGSRVNLTRTEGAGYSTHCQGIRKSKRTSHTRWPPQMTPIRETRESESDAATRSDFNDRIGSLDANNVDEDTDPQYDVFRYGSSWSMLPDATSGSRELLTLPGVVCIGNASNVAEISPMTATDSTVGYSPISELGPLEPGTRVLSESLREILRGDGGVGVGGVGASGKDSYMSLGRATLRLIGSTSTLALGRRD
ncbi:hypothetical protein D9758_012844 [Tetrapyrgos nigripes]|uniref:Uncharacterized protein n=1 Tax=Tetrapyrgos nigripes TaxID=182062 RepID=A0A8H5CAH7_9AGAR|nr:hypothetical protein D9758_012844 [Tetrapyrgos nigripes]